MWQKTSHVFREGCDQKRHKSKQKNSCARASHSSQKCDKWDAWHFLSPTNVTSLTQIWDGKLGRNPGKTDPYVKKAMITRISFSLHFFRLLGSGPRNILGRPRPCFVDMKNTPRVHTHGREQGSMDFVFWCVCWVSMQRTTKIWIPASLTGFLFDCC